jgi:positive regulator of sigma E activity
VTGDAPQPSAENARSAFFAGFGMLVLVSPSSFLLSYGAMVNPELFAEVSLLETGLLGFMGALVMFVVSGHIRQEIFVETVKIVFGSLSKSGKADEG